MKIKTLFSFGAFLILNANTAMWAASKANTPDQALDLLRTGNERFCKGVPLQRNLLEEAKATSAKQEPFAAIVSCIDSRTSSELIFDQGIGDVFNARIAGNIVNDDLIGSLEFATKVAGAKLIAIIGHTKCGAVAGAVNDVKMGHLTGLLERISPAVKNASLGQSPTAVKEPAFVDKCAEENVRLQAKQLKEQSPIIRELIEKGALRIVGGIHDLETGQVRFLADIN